MTTKKVNNDASTLDVTEMLHMDHQDLRDLFFAFKSVERGASKEKLVKEILTELFVHSTAEEEIVYSAIAKEAEALVNEAETEHRMVKYLMAELSKMKPSDDQFDAKVTVLSELVEHHVQEEEKEMFKKLRESDADLESLAEQVSERKEELRAQPLPPMQSSLSIGHEKVTNLPASRKSKPNSKKIA